MCYKTTIAELDEVCRRRTLTADESEKLARAIVAEARYGGRKSLRAWREEEDCQARRLRAQGLSYGRIAALVAPRTADAVAARLRYLRLSEE